MLRIMLPLQFISGLMIDWGKSVRSKSKWQSFWNLMEKIQKEAGFFENGFFSKGETKD